MAKIFVSHAHEDRDAARQITSALIKVELDPWLDVQDLRPGDELLRTIAKIVAEVEYFAIVLSRRALTKPWVLTEMRMALTGEIEKGHPKVLALRLDDCEVPFELRHKVYLDLRGRFDEALTELADYIKGIATAVPVPKQTVIAEMVENADDELWARLAGGSQDEWKRREAAQVIRDLTSDELQAAVDIGSWWSNIYKLWEHSLVEAIRHATSANDVRARRILKSLADKGVFDEAQDLDYSKLEERAWCAGTMLTILSRASRRSGLFPALPPPIPERLSSLLAFERSVEIFGNGWHGVRFPDPVVTRLATVETAVVAVQSDDPRRAWAFRSPDDRAPLSVERHFTREELDPIGSLDNLIKYQDCAFVGFDLATFDDLGLLRKQGHCSDRLV